MADEKRDGVEVIHQNRAQSPDNEIKRVNENSDNLLKKICCSISWVVLTGLSMLTLQYVPPYKKQGIRKWTYYIYAVIGTTLLGLLINTYPTVVTLLDWSKCPIKYFNVCYLMVLHTPPSSDRNELPDIVMRDTNNDPNIISDPTTADELERFSDYGKLVFLFSTASGTISYFFLLFCVLWRQYIWNYIFRKERKKDDKERGEEREPLVKNKEIVPDPLHPFDDTGDDTSTRLEKSEGIRFLIFLIINIALVVGMAAVFLSGLYLHHSNSVTIDNNSTKDWTSKYDKVQISVIIVYFYSLLCTISSCFIFSKVMYGIQNKCDNLFTSDDNTTIRERIDEDQKFVKLAIATQSPFEWWFFIHWVMYIITAFLSLSFLFDAISEKIQGSLPHRQPGINFSSFELVFITLFAASNSFFFLYPCIRAAGVTESRKNLIRNVSNTIDNLDANKRAFINYLKDQNFSFRLNILCAHVTFDLNIAYISIFIGLLGVLIKVGTDI